MSLLLVASGVTNLLKGLGVPSKTENFKNSFMLNHSILIWLK